MVAGIDAEIWLQTVPRWHQCVATVEMAWQYRPSGAAPCVTHELTTRGMVIHHSHSVHGERVQDCRVQLHKGAILPQRPVRLCAKPIRDATWGSELLRVTSPKLRAPISVTMYQPLKRRGRIGDATHLESDVGYGRQGMPA